MSFDSSRPFTRGQACSAGITPGQLRGPRFRLLLRGVYVGSEVTPTIQVRACAALLIHPVGAYLSHHTAAVLQGLPVPPSAVVHISVGSAADRRPQPGIADHVATSVVEVTDVGGLPVCSGPSLFVGLASVLHLVDLVVVGDAMVRRGLTTIADLTRAAESGPRLGSRAAALVRERVDSPMETRIRLLLILAGFPEPVVNAIVADRYRPDLCWPKLRLIVEYDGRHHRDDLDQWDHDIERREWFESHDWTILTVVARDVFQRPAETINRIYAAWLRAGGGSFRLRDDWRAHFATN
jgi:hypothetical protein